jgi:hypothetical protein
VQNPRLGQEEIGNHRKAFKRHSRALATPTQAPNPVLAHVVDKGRDAL